ncbi:transposase [Kitasatospora sp. NPDC057542]|uniref:IS701 family transposase n=1 Tax=Kitasatospora sp. NPDC057542 TaxID=3346162 RepID=UPI0036D0EA15
MLPDPTVPASLLAVLELVRGCFTAPTFQTFAAPVTGLIAQTVRCTVTGILLGAGLTRTWSHDRAHAFFSRVTWKPDLLGIALSHLVVRRLLSEGAVLTVTVDDTLFKRRGKKVFGAAWQHDGAARGSRPVGRGTCFVVVGIVVQLPFLARPVCLPVMARLWRPQQEQSKAGLAASMIRLLAACHDGRHIHVVADAAYHGKALRALPSTCTFTTRLPASAVLYDLAPPPTGRRGRPALKGQRLGTAKDLADTADFTTATVTRYQRTETVHLTATTCLWYGSFHTRTVRIVLLRDEDTVSGYDLALVTTDLDTPLPDLVTRYAWCWPIEVTFAEARDLFGAGQAQSRTRHAVERTVPFSLYCYTITVVWYALHGHHPADAAEHRERAPWYTTKADPSLSDMVAKLRRVIIAARFTPNSPGRPTDEEIHAVQQAWAAASAA